MKQPAVSKEIEASKEEAAGSSYDKLFAVLEAIAALDGCSLTQVAERSGLPFSTVHRIAGELADRGYVTRPKRGEYRVGPSVFMLTRNASMRGLLAETSRPFLATLARACRTHVHLGIFEDDMVTYLANAAYGRDHFPLKEGMQLEAYCSGIGKVLLAHLPNADRESYFAQGEFVALTPNTLVSREALAKELEQVRARGWGTDLEEVEPDLRCIAVPLTDSMGTVHAAISASIHSKDGSAESLMQFLPPLHEAANGIAAKLFQRRTGFSHDSL